MSLHRVSSRNLAPLEEFPGFPRGLQTLLQLLQDEAKKAVGLNHFRRNLVLLKNIYLISYVICNDWYICVFHINS
ncbi:hypothetical protein OUZ56_003481 [Daphnia magna]|uniref:Uncharacterized protein n=1 Tax=Daphnia magna TaxID=35525 RepID=A0ABR0A8V9_9CRUS|nr:hypothetical protein OUZ56_003481 [Daphnia magna]